MVRWKAGAALLALALALLTGGAQAAVAQPFEPLPVTDRAYRAVQHLERAGYFTGAPAGTFSGRTPRTRYEFAVAVERIFRSFQPRVLDPNDPAVLLQDLQILRPLLAQFSEDIGALGPDVRELKQQMATMEKRLLRALEPEKEKEEALSPAVLSPTPLDSPLSFGVRSKLRQHLVANWLSKQTEQPVSDLTRSPFGPSLKPRVAALLGPALVGFDVEDTDPLISDVGMPLMDPADHRTIRAHLTLPVGSYLASAYYNRLGANWDPFGQWAAISGGPAEDVGAQFSGPLISRIGFQFQGGSLRGLVDDPTRVGYLKTGVNYDIGRFHLETGYERFHQYGMLGGITSGYYLGMGRSFGRAELNAILRSGDNSSAVTQFSIRF